MESKKVYIYKLKAWHIFGSKLQLKFVAKSFNLKSTKAPLMSKFLITSLSQIRDCNHVQFESMSWEKMFTKILGGLNFILCAFFVEREGCFRFPRLFFSYSPQLKMNVLSLKVSIQSFKVFQSVGFSFELSIKRGHMPLSLAD